MKIENFKLKIVFFGSSRFIIPIIEVLKKNFNLGFVVTTEKQSFDPVPTYCTKSKVCYYVVTDFWKKKALDKLKKIDPDIGILASFGAIVPKSVFDIFKYGILNIHPSLLPKYRGPAPVQTAILSGDKTTGITVIKLDEQVDHGPVLFQKKEAILENDTSQSLYERLFKLAAYSIVKIIELYLKGEIKPREQNHKQATFTKRLTREDGYIDMSNVPAQRDQMSKVKIDRMIKAYYPWPGVWTEFTIQNSEFRIKFLPEKKIQVEGKNPMSYKDFLNGYPEAAKNLEFIIQD